MVMTMYRNSAKLRLGSRPLPQTDRMSSNVGEGQTVARISVKDRLGPLPATAGRSAFKRRRGRSLEGKNNNSRRERKYSKSLEEEPGVVESTSARIPVHERLGALPPPQQQHQQHQQHQQQFFKRSDQLFHKRNRQQVWKHQDYKEIPQQQSKEEFIPEMENVNPSFIKPPPAAVVPSVPPRAFNAEQHRQAWTWVRPGTNPSTNSSAAMDVDDIEDKVSS